MEKLQIEICNERFLPRFGVDRLLVLLGRRLADCGHRVTFSCLRADTRVLAPISDDINVLEVSPGLGMGPTEKTVLERVTQRWAQSSPDVVITGGWPFFRAVSNVRCVGARSIFIDAGAVAQNDVPDPLLKMQQELRRIRQLTLPVIDRVLPISNFIRFSQSIPDRGSDEGVRTVLLGADHIRLGTFPGQQQSSGRDLTDRLRRRVQNGEKLILCLGRFELHGYKNSRAAYQLLRLVQRTVPKARLLVLDGGQDCKVPPDLRRSVELLGVPDDRSLQQVMAACDLGVSLSLWEGFNLPLAEMQWLGRPALAFNVGAHPEVVAHPWLLAEDAEEMAAKAIALLAGNGTPDFNPSFAAFRQRRSWERTLATWQEEIVELSRAARDAERAGVHTEKERRCVLIDLTNASRDPANPGVIRVARRLSSVLQHHSHLDVVFAAWNDQTGDYAFLDEVRRRFLQGFGGPQDGLGQMASSRPNFSVSEFLAALVQGGSGLPVLLIPETILEGHASRRMQWARARGFKAAVILYDLIPVFYSEMCGAQVTKTFPEYLEAVLQADAVWTISNSTMSDFQRYAERIGRSLPPVATPVILPGEFSGQPHRPVTVPDTQREIRILCVSTLEPRKNHARLLDAFMQLRQRRPDLSLRLVLVGNRYAGAPEIVEKIKWASRKDPQIEWQGIIDDRRLAQEFERATFTVYPSVVEGFGLPIMESLWMGRPCITHSAGVMQELASGGGCLVADMTNVEEISRALERLAAGPALVAELAKQAQARHITTWEEYGNEIARHLITL